MIDTIKEILRLYKLLLERKKLNETYTKDRVIDIIEVVCAEEDVDPRIAIAVAECESGLNPNARRVNRNGTIDRGVFQWNDFYHPEVSDLCAYDVRCATKHFCRAYKSGNLWWWDASKRCWYPKIKHLLK